MQINNLLQNEWESGFRNDSDAVILDVRTPMEWSEGIIEGATMINIMDGEDFMDEVEKLDKSKSYYVYCKSGGRSGQACSVMSQLGFGKTYNLIGGITAWSGDVVQP